MTQIIVFTLFAAILVVLVRPGSPAATGVVTWGNAITAVVGTATGYVQRGG